jgi:hypothetical protein
MYKGKDNSSGTIHCNINKNCLYSLSKILNSPYNNSGPTLMGYISCSFAHIITNISFNVHHLFETDDAPDSPNHWFQFDMTRNLNVDFLFGKHLHWVAVRYVRCVSTKNTNIEKTQSIPGCFLIEERYINEVAFKVEKSIIMVCGGTIVRDSNRSLWCYLSSM